MRKASIKDPTFFRYNMMLVPNLFTLYTVVLCVTLNGQIIGRWVIVWMSPLGYGRYGNYSVRRRVGGPK